MGLLDQITNATLSIGKGVLSSKVSTNRLPILNKGFNIAEAFLHGGIGGALDTAVNSGIITDLIKESKPFQSAMGQYLGSNLHAKLSIKDVQQITALAFAIEHARKNLWLLSISPYQPAANNLFGNISGMVGNVAGGKISQMLGGGSIGNITGKITSQIVSSTINSLPLVGTALANSNGEGTTSAFNMLATDLNYSFITLEGEQYNIGSSVIDGPKLGSPVEISITTMDDEQGTIKRAFQQWSSNVVHQDGTIGVMADGLLHIRILHAFVGDNVNIGGYESNIIARPVGVEYDLSRREQAVEEFTMRFIQTDTFI
ncbi:hypothetical protein [Gallibacterium sp. AGMB14963]|uniref:hypothetical protein n=1 Tax=Gallibacterium faecale TaxID=3019086 RepID=UPI0022F15B43|nr:hypothetical protein [Gallibacterium sp. AGMB14963]MDA3977607.1 hypothetical protein [Gallibacterium sp. AGMB14963]